MVGYRAGMGKVLVAHDNYLEWLHLRFRRSRSLDVWFGLFSDLDAVARSAVERLRIEVARQRVQSSSEAIERVAQVTGFRDPERMRRAFIRAFGQPPQSLRRAARAG
jgi:transcriptional regulator GlxA family with amidase domain